MAGTARAVFLDRDGVLNRVVMRRGKPHPPDTLEELELLPGVPEACRLLKANDFLLVMVTNQPDIGRGTQSADVVDAMNRRLSTDLRLDGVMVCPHDDSDGCACRKPRPGMLLEAAEVLAIAPSSSFMVGDRWRDIEAGCRAGCRTVWIRSEYDEKRPEGADYTAASLADAAKLIIEEEPGNE
ncbi:MAG TPA: HAD family hydrolase [Bryobacteraceae bacterium]|nr:HAD family hydrolase [Bryobacteraceae bacterium]